MDKKLIVTADDYGVWSNIDRGIRRCANAGVLDNIDIIVTQGKHSEKSVKKLIFHNKKRINSGELKLGLHLCLSCGTPLYTSDKDYLKTIARKVKVKPLGTKKYIFRYSSGVKMIKNIGDITDQHINALEQEMIAQYNKFKQIVGREPSQVSSHLGVYNANEKIYKVLKKFCEDRNLAMRCPTLISMESSFDTIWEDPKQKLLPEGAIKFITGKEGKEILKWVRGKQRTMYDADRENGLEGRDYFIEHFFKNGSIENLNKIVSNCKASGEHTYEMVVHPVASDKTHGIPIGVEKLGFRKRYDEFITLIKPASKEALDNYNNR